MFGFLFCEIILLPALFAVFILLHRSLKQRLYRFRNIALIALLPALLSAMAMVAANYYGKAERSFAALTEYYPGFFAQITVFAFFILFVLMAVSNIALMRHEGMALRNMAGSLFQFLFIAGTLSVYLLVRLADRWFGGSPNALVCYLCRFVPLYLYCLIDYCECITIGIMILGWIAARARPHYDRDYIIIPGCSIRRDGGLLPLLRGRVNKAIRFAWDQEIAVQKPLRYVPSGGQGPDEIMSEGSAMAMYLMSHGAEPEEVMAEKQSVNTYENFRLSKQAIDALTPGAKVAFATTNYHVLRCGMIANYLGLDAEGIASGTKWYFWPNGFARETVAIFVLNRRVHIIAAGLLALAAAAVALL